MVPADYGARMQGVGMDALGDRFAPAHFLWSQDAAVGDFPGIVPRAGMVPRVD